MPTLFDPIQAGDLHLANRIAMAPLTRNRSPRAVPRDITATYYAQRASAGLLITEGTAITHQGQGYSDVPGLYGTEQLDGWKRVIDIEYNGKGRYLAFTPATSALWFGSSCNLPRPPPSWLRDCTLDITSIGIESA